MTHDPHDPARRTPSPAPSRRAGRDRGASAWIWAAAAFSLLVVVGILIWGFGNDLRLAQRPSATPESTVQQAPASSQGDAKAGNTGQASPRTASDPVPQGRPQGQR